MMCLHAEQRGCRFGQVTDKNDLLEEQADVSGDVETVLHRPWPS